MPSVASLASRNTTLSRVVREGIDAAYDTAYDRYAAVVEGMKGAIEVREREANQRGR